MGSSIIPLLVTSAWMALRSQRDHRKRGSFWWLALLAPCAIFTAYVTANGAFRLAGFRLFKIPSSSMAPTIQEGDSLVADMWFYRDRDPQRGDLCVIRQPKEEGVLVVKRVIAIGGDSIESRGSMVYVNGKLMDEPYVQHKGDAPDWMADFGPISIPEHEFFVMGDNRDLSLDSRSPEFGLVKNTDVTGKALYLTNSRDPGARF